MLNKLPPTTVAHFRSLGAVRYSYFRPRGEFQGGLLFFWNADGRQIGYGSTLTTFALTFDPPRLVDVDMLEEQIYGVVT